MPSSPRPRRTQAERRAAMRALLVEATIDAIFEEGYAAASIQQIVARAGVTQGALFRHFPTRLDLIVETCTQVIQRQLDVFEDIVDAAEPSMDLRTTLEAIRDLTLSRQGVVIRDVATNARSDEALRERVAPLAEDYYARLSELGDALAILQGIPDPLRGGLTALVTCYFDGQGLRSGVLAQPDANARAVDFLLAAAQAIGVETETGAE